MKPSEPQHAAALEWRSVFHIWNNRIIEYRIPKADRSMVFEDFDQAKRALVSIRTDDLADAIYLGEPQEEIDRLRLLLDQAVAVQPVLAPNQPALDAVAEKGGRP